MFGPSDWIRTPGQRTKQPFHVYFNASLHSSRNISCAQSPLLQSKFPLQRENKGNILILNLTSTQLQFLGFFLPVWLLDIFLTLIGMQTYNFFPTSPTSRKRTGFSCLAHKKTCSLILDLFIISSWSQPRSGTHACHNLWRKCAHHLLWSSKFGISTQSFPLCKKLY